MSRELKQAARRVRLVAEGGTINGTYKRLPIAALVAFRDDLLAILAVLPGGVGE